MGNLLFHPSLNALAMSAIAAVGLIIWFILRKRFRRVWFPMIQILVTPPKKLPRFRLRKPPMIPFICFLVAVLCLVFLSFRPQRNIFVPMRPDEARIHVLFDLSPSNSIYLSEAAYQEKASKLIENLFGKANVTVSTTANDSIFKISDESGLKEFVSQLVYHRPGARIGALFSLQSSKIGSLDQMIIFGDADRYSWEDFSWKHLSSQTDIYHYNLESERSVSKQNISIGSAINKYSDNFTSEWELEILRNYSGVSGSGVLKAWSGGALLNTQNFQFKNSEKNILLDITLPLTQIKNVRKELVVWTLETSDADAMKLDNEFRSQLSGDQIRTLLVGSSSSESLTLDQLQRLSVALEKSGARVKRIESLAEAASVSENDLVILNFNENESDAVACHNLSLRDTTVWFLPSAGRENDFKLMCECFATILSEKSVPVNLCGDVTNRNSWVSFLSSIGAKQIGGSISSVEDSLAFEKAANSAQGRLVGFTLPVLPMNGGPINHGNFPIIVRRLIEHQFIKSKSENNSKTGVQVANVPKGESRLDSLNNSELPPPLLINFSLNQERTLSRQQESDPKGILRVLGVLIAFSMAVEILWWLWKLRLRTVMIWLVLFSAIASQSAFSEIQLTVVGATKQKITLQELAKDVSSRTSIELDPMPEMVPLWDDSVLERPMFWALGTQVLQTKKGSFAEKLGRWLRKGGFIFIESDVPSSQALFEKALGVQPESIPPDHELMRSFYLLDALPNCKGVSWKAFQFDKRLVGLLVPPGTLESASDSHAVNDCSKGNSQEKTRRAIINALMVALATDYKRDQIHLPEILKRLR